MIESRAATLALFLGQLGSLVSSARVRALARGDLSPRSVARVLQHHQVPVRCTTPELGLLHLPLPALLDLQSGQLCILESVQGSTALLRHADETLESCPTARLTGEIATIYERVPSFREGVPFSDGLLSLLRSQGGALLRLGCTVLVQLCLGVLSPWLVREAVAQATGDRSVSLLTTLVSALCAAACMRAWVGWLGARASVTLEANALRVVVPLVFRRTLRLSFVEQQRTGVAEQLATLAAAEVATTTAASLMVAPAVEALLLLSYLLALGSASHSGGAAFAAAALVTVAVSFPLARFRTRADARALHEAGHTRSRLHELIHGIATVKAEHAEQAVLHRWLDALLRERTACLTRDLCTSWLELWLLGSQQALQLLLLWYGAHEVLSERASLADFLYVVMLGTAAVGSTQTACRLLASAMSLRTHGARVDDMLRRAGVHTGPSESLARAHSEPFVVHLSDVWFRHDAESPWILEGYNLRVKRGEHLCLRSASGTGKTTILRLIAGLYRPERGTVSVAGHDPSRERSAICYLPQQATLFAGSMRDNLEQISGQPLSRIVQAAEQTGCAAWLRGLPMGIETVVAAQGANLSGGQRQWLLLTAAVASDRPLVLLDEATSQIDLRTRSDLPIPLLFAGRTTIRVAHDV